MLKKYIFQDIIFCLVLVFFYWLYTNYIFIGQNFSWNLNYD
jgi:hypothetical protein